MGVFYNNCCFSAKHNHGTDTQPYAHDGRMEVWTDVLATEELGAVRGEQHL